MHVFRPFLSLAILALIASEVRAALPLCSTMDGIPAVRHGIASQQLADYASATLRAADDFVVPAPGPGWTVTAVAVDGMYLNRPETPQPPLAVQVYVYDDDAGKPRGLHAGEARFAAELPYTDLDAGDFYITLPGAGIFLPPGRYWLSVVAVLPVSTGGQWVWTESASAVDSGRPNGHESVWTQSPRLSPYGCVGQWDARCGVCGVVGDPMDERLDPDLAFAIYGATGDATQETGITSSPSATADAVPVAVMGNAMAEAGFVAPAAVAASSAGQAEAIETAGQAWPSDGTTRLTLTDLLYVIALYNAGGYACAADGTPPCSPSPFDRSPLDWRISLSELLRVVQFYEAGGYRNCADSEDGYCPVFD